MSTARRLISGSAASWVRILITFLTQIILVPIFLTYWDTKTYGIWIALTAMINILTFIDKGQQAYLGFEFLKYGGNKNIVSKLFWSHIIWILLINVIQILIIIFLIQFKGIETYISSRQQIGNGLMSDTIISLLILGINYFINVSIISFLTLLLQPYGYYSRMAWLNVGSAFITSVAPIGAIILGYGLVGASITLLISTLIFNIFVFIDQIKIIKKENIKYISPSLKIGFTNFYNSLVITIKNILEDLRHQGFRIILTPLIGIDLLAAFTTMRTGTNVALQGLGTITNPMMPELMRFLNRVEQEKYEAAVSTIWLILIIGLCPGVIFLQICIEPIFDIWTRGKIDFDPQLFAILSITVLIFAQAQPAIAIIRGNNLLKPQIGIALVTTFILIAGMIPLIKQIGLVGAGIILLFTELISTIGYKIAAQKWLKSKNLIWPQKSSKIALQAVIFTSIILEFIIYTPNFFYQVILGMCSLIVLFFITQRFWSGLPYLLKNRINNYLPFFPKKNNFRVR